MSEREDAQNLLIEAISRRHAQWNAPYGVLAGTHRIMRGGVVRTVTFGVARFLDATAYIWSTGKIVVRAEGALADRVEGEYKSVAELVARLDDVLPPR